MPALNAPKPAPGTGHRTDATYLPDRHRLFFWDGDDIGTPPAWPHGKAGEACLGLPGHPGGATVSGILVRPDEAAELLAGMRADGMTPSLRAWHLAARITLDMVARGRFLPVAEQADSPIELHVRWQPVFDVPGDRRRRMLLRRSVPSSAVCSVAPNDQPDDAGRTDGEGAGQATVDAFISDVTDALVRRAAPTPSVLHGWETDFVEHLGHPPGIPLEVSSPTLKDQILAWLTPPSERRSWIGTTRLLEPDDIDGWRLVFGVVSEEDPDHRLSAEEVWASADAQQVAALQRAMDRAVLAIPDAAGRIETVAALAGGVLDLLPDEAWKWAQWVGRDGAGDRDRLPPGLRSGDRLRLRLYTDDDDSAPGMSDTFADLLARTDRLDGSWEVLLGDRPLDMSLLDGIDEGAAPLVEIDGEWHGIDPLDLMRIREHLKGGPPRLSPAELVIAVLARELTVDDATHVEIVARGAIARFARLLRDTQTRSATAPDGLDGTLRHYQERGLGWLLALQEHGFGGCLADDMGLGKTVQAIALMLSDTGPTLVVCPTSVLGNWERELTRFAPTLQPVRHHGPGRASTPDDLASSLADRNVVLTTYALLRRDVDVLAEQKWHRVVLDEAQHMKNPSTETARAARRAGAAATSRLALTGTPVENHLVELWSILDFCNPGLLGGQETFRRRFAVPIERKRDDATAERLRRMTAPFVLRRRKTDPEIAPDLPDKHETTLYCNLTPEQARLYREAVAEGLGRVQRSGGMARRGQVLALLTRLKQICNHPALVTGSSRIGADDEEHSGKLHTLLELVAEVREEGDRSLVFTQYVQMGEILAEVLGGMPFLHGSLSQPARDAMVLNFQESPDAPDVLVVSLRAGGLGLNLAAANRVFHYDRWWNPAVEDQATDRAHRIGQTRDVWVHKLVCMGTLEERIDELLARKRGMADRILGDGDSWLTELTDDELAALVALEDAAVL